jgi:hypothetical protein
MKQNTAFILMLAFTMVILLVGATALPPVMALPGWKSWVATAVVSFVLAYSLSMVWLFIIRAFDRSQK